jgi:hypothetical protein
MGFFLPEATGKQQLSVERGKEEKVGFVMCRVEDRGWIVCSVV